MTDIDFSSLLSSDKFLRMQVLEKKNKNKWYLWMLQGRGGSDKHSEKINEYFNKTDAMAAFEKTFYLKTCNKWTDRSLFS